MAKSVYEPPCSLGEFRYTVSFNTRADISNTLGDPVKTYTEYAIQKCAIRPLGTQTMLNGVQVDFEVTHTFYSTLVQQCQLNDTLFVNITLPDGSMRIERYNVRAIGLWRGLPRYMKIDCRFECFAPTLVAAQQLD
jgi:hypothetical protein